MDALERLLARHEVKLVALQTACQNPTGRDISEERRARLAGAGEGAQLLRAGGPRLRRRELRGASPCARCASWRPAHVIYVNSLSKVVGGGLRAGWVAARGPVRERIAMLKLESDFHSATLIQHICGALARAPAPTTATWSTRSPSTASAATRCSPPSSATCPASTRPTRPRAGTTSGSRSTRAARRTRPLHGGRAPRRHVHARRRDHGRAAHADLVPAVVLAARAARARRGREAARARDPRGAPPGAPRRGGADVVAPSELLPERAEACAARRARSGSGSRRRTPSRCVCARRVEERAGPSGVISAKKPRASLSQRSRFRRPSRSRRSTSRVRPLRLSSTDSASSAMRMRPAPGRRQEEQHLVRRQRQVVLARELGVELLRERGVRAEHPAPGRQLLLVEEHCCRVVADTTRLAQGGHPTPHKTSAGDARGRARPLPRARRRRARPVPAARHARPRAAPARRHRARAAVAAARRRALVRRAAGRLPRSRDLPRHLSGAGRLARRPARRARHRARAHGARRLLPGVGDVVRARTRRGPPATRRASWR